jgi:competence protein ComEC
VGAELRDRYQLGTALLRIWHPRPAWPTETFPELSSNDNSIGLSVTFQGRSLLLPGDMESLAEQRLLQGVTSSLHVDVLKVPHHGSRTSSTWPFLVATWPRMAVFEVGLHNRFGFPHPDVMARYRNLGIETFRTDLDGLVQMTLSTGGISVRHAPW